MTQPKIIVHFNRYDLKKIDTKISSNQSSMSKSFFFEFGWQNRQYFPNCVCPFL